MKTFDSDFSCIEGWFTDQYSKPLEIEGKININLVINQYLTYQIRYSVEPRGGILVKDYGFLFFVKNIGKNMSKSLNGESSQKLVNHARQSSTDVLKTTWKRVPKKSRGITSAASRRAHETTSQAEDKYISPVKGKQIIDDLRLI